MLRFQHPWTLWWLLAAIVPMWLHWRRRRPVRELDWAAMELLRRALRRQRLRWRVQDLVLLLLRMATIFVLVLALAQPEWSAISRPGGGSAKVATHHLLLFDGSFSMQTIAGGTSRFERARQQALSLIDRQPPRDQFSVWLADPLPRPVLFPPSSNHRDVQRTLAALQPSAGRSDWSRLPEVLTSYQTESTAEPTQGWLLSDMQRSAGFDAINALSAAWQQLLRQTQLRIIDVGDTVVDNTAVTSLNVRRGRAIIHEPCVIVSDIRNHSPRQELTTVVTLYVYGTAVARQSVRIPPRDKISVEFSHVFHQTGTVELQVQTEGDQLAIDDQRFGVIDVVDRVPSRLRGRHAGGRRIRGRRHSRRKEPMEHGFVCSASTRTGPRSIHQRGCRRGLQRRSHRGDRRDTLDGTCAWWRRSAGLSGWRRRRRTATAGIDRCQAVRRRPNTAVLARRSAPAAGWYLRIGCRIRSSHPWLQRLAESDAGSLRSTPDLALRATRSCYPGRTAAEYSDGAAALVGHRWGDGYVLLCGTPASVSSRPTRTGTPCPVWPSFPPLVRELAWYAAQPRTANAQRG